MFPAEAYQATHIERTLPAWAKSDAMRAAFPDMAHKTSGTASDKATLAGTITGWQVPE